MYLEFGSRPDGNRDASNSAQVIPLLGEREREVEEEGGLDSSLDVSSNDTDAVFSLSSMQFLCGWYNTGNMTDLPWIEGDTRNI